MIGYEVANFFLPIIVEAQAPPEQTLHEKMSEMHVCQNILLDQINSIKNLCKDKEKSHVRLVLSL